MFIEFWLHDTDEVVELVNILKEYLPTQMSDEELEKIIDGAIVESDGLFGNVMKVVIAKVAGRVGGDRIVPIVKNKLATRN